jgi:hypothetical protein
MTGCVAKAAPLAGVEDGAVATASLAAGLAAVGGSPQLNRAINATPRTGIRWDGKARDIEALH